MASRDEMIEMLAAKLCHKDFGGASKWEFYVKGKSAYCQVVVVRFRSLAAEIIDLILSAIAELSEEQMDAANALPITKQVDGLIAWVGNRYGGATSWPLPPDSPIQQWYRAMIGVLRRGGVA